MRLNAAFTNDWRARDTQNQLLDCSTFQLSLGRELDVPNQSTFLQAANDDPAEIELPPLEAMSRRCWECVMVVVPTFTVTEYPEEQIIAGVVGRLEVLRSKDMADRIDRPSHVMRQANACQSTPQQAKPCT